MSGITRLPCLRYTPKSLSMVSTVLTSIATSGPVSTMISLTESVHMAGMMREITRAREATDEVLHEIVGAELSSGWPAGQLSL